MPKGSKRPHGQLRQSQVVTTFGPGSMLDLPNHSVLVAGLDEWLGRGDEIHEPRLIEKLCYLLRLDSLRLFFPPPDSEDPTAPATGILGWKFPLWYVTQEPDRDHPGSRTRRLVHQNELQKGKLMNDDHKSVPVVPIRFVRACPRGHIGDIDWYVFVHGGATECRRRLWVDERGTSGDLSEVWVRCDCGDERPVITALIQDSHALGHCDGARPWLGQFSSERCAHPNRLLIRSASNAYFPQVLSVISLPQEDEDLKKAVDQVWDFVESAESADDIQHERKKAKVQQVLKDFDDQQIFAEITTRRMGGSKQTKKVKEVEIEILTANKEEIGEDRADSDFYARNYPREKWDKPWMKDIARVLLVKRLRETVAQLGFTRFEAVTPGIEGEPNVDVERASLAREVTWLPAVENKGEGIFLQFDKNAIDSWLAREDVKDRGRQLIRGFECWLHEHNGSERQFPFLPYFMIHSFSHLLITSMSLECGYPASSIRERVYALPNLGYGLLLYTGSSDAEGTLGGLVEVGRHIQDHVYNALRIGQLCSNDPVCAQHQPENEHERRYLQGAACHGCVLIAETSCEQYNDFLDRALVVPTIEGTQCAFFDYPLA